MTQQKTPHDQHFGKLTMKDTYAHKRFFAGHIRGYIDLLRPFTLMAPFIVSMSIMVASLVYNKGPIASNWWFIVGNASLTIAIVNAASNALNQAADVEGDCISKPYRPIPKGIIKADEAQSLSYILYLFALLRAVTVNYWFGIFVFLIMIFTVTYSLPPRIKRYLFINQLWIAIPRGLLGILAGWSVFGDPFQPLPLIIGSMATLFLAGGMSTKDIVDAKADRLVGVRTLVNTLGTRRTAVVSIPFMIAPFIFIPIFIDFGWLEHYFWPLSILMIGSLLVFYLMFTDNSESSTLENVHAWSIMYIVYILYALGFSVLTIFHEPLQQLLNI